MTRPFLTLAAAAVLCNVALCAAATPVAAQQAPSVHTTQEWIALGNAAYEARNAAESLKDYEAALALDAANYDALWRAARSGIDLGQYEPNEAKQKAIFALANERADRAVKQNPGDAWGHFVLAAALGRTAQSLGTRDRIKYAGQVRDQALQCLKIDPKHSGCLHVMGEWNAEVMRLNGFSRMIARNFLGGKVFDQANWADAQRYLVEAVTNDPRRIVHRLDLGRVYADRGLKAQARSQFQIVIDGDLIDYNDPHYKEEARQALNEL